MFNPSSKHFDFLEKLANNQTQTQLPPDDISREDLADMVNLGLIVEYFNQGSRTRYAIIGGGIAALSTRPVTEFVKPDGKVEDLNMKDPKVIEAIEFVRSRGYEGNTPEILVAEWGADYILDSKSKAGRG